MALSSFCWGFYVLTAHQFVTVDAMLLFWRLWLPSNLLISLMCCIWPPRVGPRFFHPKFTFLLLYCSLLLSDMLIALAFFFRFLLQFWDCFFFQVRSDVCLFGHCSDSVLSWNVSMDFFWDLYICIYIYIYIFTFFFPPVKYRNSVWERWLKCCSGAYWLFLSLGGHGQRSGLIPMKSFRKKKDHCPSCILRTSPAGLCDLPFS